MMPSPGDLDTHVLLRAFADELARCGVRHAVTSPGSRSTPIVLALHREQRLRTWSHIDERSAGFFALGLAKASGLPAVVTCTSGTAAVELHPAVVEAYEARVPMIVLTADRPAELREVGAGQAIDQQALYGRAAKWFFDVGTHEATPERQRWMRSLACRAFWTALQDRPGPVHLNVPLREPLAPGVPIPEPLPGRRNARPWLVRQFVAAEPDQSAAVLHPHVLRATRGVVVAGREERSTDLGDVAAAFAAGAGWPLLADPLSRARRGPAAVAHYEALLRDAAFRERWRPDLVVRIGDLPTSKPLRRWLASLADVCQVAIDPDGAWQDPDAVVAESLAADPAAALAGLAGEVPRAEPGWLEGWRAADDAAAGAIEDVLGDDALSEPAVAAELGSVLPAEATLVVASSMPVRDVETFWAPRLDPPRVLANRGANGIDGTTATAFGVAAAGEGPVVLLTGDVAFANDLSSLAACIRLQLPLIVVLVNNDGGGIFHFLPVAAERDAFDEHVATPHGLHLGAVARALGCRHHVMADRHALRAALAHAVEDRDGVLVLEARTDREDNLALHRRVWAEVANALEATKAPPARA
jgi:2-succinyl-5-enolpyruvyl-6-hydroxy-3-cyclohexene-1-carboxylate synthase